MGHARHALSQIFSAKKALHKNIANFNRTLSRQTANETLFLQIATR